MSREWIIDDDFLDEETKSSADGQGYLTELVRCKDCRWKQGSECVRFADVRPFPDDFCSKAERKDIAQEKQER